MSEPRMIVSLDQLPDPCPERFLDGLAGKSWWHWRGLRLQRIGPAWLQIGRTFCYRRADLEAFLQARRVDGPSLRAVGGGRP